MQHFFQSLRRCSGLIPVLGIFASIPVTSFPVKAASVPPSRKLKSVHYSAAAEIARQSEEIRQLHAELKALALRLDAQENKKQQTATPVVVQADIPQKAVPLNTNELKNEQPTLSEQQLRLAAAIDSIPDQINKQVDKSVSQRIDKKLKFGDWFANTHIGMRMYSNASYVNYRQDGQAAAWMPGRTSAPTSINTPAGNIGYDTKNRPVGDSMGFDLKRFYLMVDHKFNDNWAARLTTDASYISGVGEAIYIKHAYLEGKQSDALSVRFGAADLPWLPFVENLYGYRWVENTSSERANFATSADWGIFALGKLWNGLVEYNMAVVDGSGYRSPFRSKNPDFEGRINVNYAGFTVGGGAHIGHQGQERGQLGQYVYNAAQRYNAVIAYVHGRFRFGGEYFYAKDFTASSLDCNLNACTTDSTLNKKDAGQGWSGWGSIRVLDRVSVFGRYDWAQPFMKSDSHFRDHYFNAGVDWQPIKNIDVGLVYKQENVTNNGYTGTVPIYINTTNGAIGGMRSASYREVGLFTNFNF
ncbi:MAG: porin [Zymomonas mobilis subsp. pomaceae]|uniref:porin n=1 Tax=Zymomonas mobilis TaxID=542 RepID=UPI0039E9FB20